LPALHLLLVEDRTTHDEQVDFRGCPGEHHDLNWMGPISSRIASVDRAAARPQIADIP
jgi:hypothetical protein